MSKRGSLQWFIKAVSDNLAAMAEKPSRDIGAFFLRHAINAARATGMLPKPQAGDSILVINLTSHFGDGVMLLPMLEAIHNANPAVSIDIACARGADSMFAAVPFMRNIYAVPLPSAPPLTLRAAIKRRMAIYRWYRAEHSKLHPQICLMPRWGDDLFGSVFLAYLIGAPRRVGYTSTVDRNQRTAPQRDRMLTETITGGQGLHEPLRFLRIAQQAGLISKDQAFRTDVVSHAVQQIADSVDWQQLQQRLALPSNAKLAVFAPGASSPTRTWPVDHWITAARMVQEAGFNVVLLSGAGDRPFAQQIQSGLPAESTHVVAGVTTLPESIALMAHADVFLGSDSGPGHAAGALGVPTGILFVAPADVDPDHPNGPPRIGPMGPYVRGLYPTLLPPCKSACVQPYPHCITTISAETAVNTLLDQYRKKLAEARDTKAHGY